MLDFEVYAKSLMFSPRGLREMGLKPTAGGLLVATGDDDAAALQMAFRREAMGQWFRNQVTMLPAGVPGYVRDRMEASARHNEAMARSIHESIRARLQ